MMNDTYQIKYYRNPNPGKNSYRIIVQNMHTYEYLEDKEIYADKTILDEVLTEMKSKYNPSHLCEVCY